MSLVVFRSKAAGEIYMFAETARRIFDILGKDDTPRGVITADQVPDALARLTAAVDAEKEALRAAQQQSDDAERRGDEPAVHGRCRSASAHFRWSRCCAPRRRRRST